MAMVAGLHKKHNKQVITISTLNSDIMAKIHDCNLFKEENKSLTLQVKALKRKLSEINE
jgi:hypothetical protein